MSAISIAESSISTYSIVTVSGARKSAVLAAYQDLISSSATSPASGSGGGRMANSTSRRSPSNTIRRSSCRSEEHTSELQSRENLVCRLLLEKKKTTHH